VNDIQKILHGHKNLSTGERGHQNVIVGTQSVAGFDAAGAIRSIFELGPGPSRLLSAPSPCRPPASGVDVIPQLPIRPIS
jgi:hypothetical protein